MKCLIWFLWKPTEIIRRNCRKSSLKGFSAAVVGGLKSTWGAVIGGMLLGFVEVFTAGLVPGGTKFQNVIAFLVVIIFIVFKPEGIIGEKVAEKV